MEKLRTTDFLGDSEPEFESKFAWLPVSCFQGWGLVTLCPLSVGPGPPPPNYPPVMRLGVPAKPAPLGALRWHKPDFTCEGHFVCVWGRGVSHQGRPSAVAPPLSWIRGSLHTPTGLSEEHGQNGDESGILFNFNFLLGEPHPSPAPLSASFAYPWEQVRGSPGGRWRLRELMVGSSSSLDKIDPQGVGSLRLFPPQLSLLRDPPLPHTPSSALLASCVTTINPLPLLISSFCPTSHFPPPISH